MKAAHNRWELVRDRQRIGLKRLVGKDSYAHANFSFACEGPRSAAWTVLKLTDRSGTHLEHGHDRAAVRLWSAPMELRTHQSDPRVVVLSGSPRKA
jgi:hypothetical protein